VIAIEADPKNYQALKEGIKLNGFENVVPITLLLGIKIAK
jgi:tRNA G37 N-methylase Trm5